MYIYNIRRKQNVSLQILKELSMSELSIHRVTDVNVTRNQHKSFMCITVITTSVDDRGIISTDKQCYYSKDNKIKLKVNKIRIIE